MTKRKAPAEPIPAVRVELTGPQSGSRTMVLDANDWEIVADRLGDRWAIGRFGKGIERIYTSRPSAMAAAKATTGSSQVFLHRFVANLHGRVRGRCVAFANGDVTDLRAANLILGANARPRGASRTGSVKVTPLEPAPDAHQEISSP